MPALGCQTRQGVLRLDSDRAGAYPADRREERADHSALCAPAKSAGDSRYKVKVLRNGGNREREVVIGARNGRRRGGGERTGRGRRGCQRNPARAAK